MSEGSILLCIICSRSEDRSSSRVNKSARRRVRVRDSIDGSEHEQNSDDDDHAHRYSLASLCRCSIRMPAAVAPLLGRTGHAGIAGMT